MSYGLSLEERRLRLLESGCCGGGEGGDMESGPDESGGDSMNYDSPLDRTLDMLKNKKKVKKGKKDGA